MTAIPTESLWRADDIASDESFAIDIDVAELTEAAELLRATGCHVASVASAALPLGGAARTLTEIRHRLTEGRGIALLRGFPVGDVADETIEFVFWRVGLALGTPVSQSVMGERFGHIVDHSHTDPDARAYRRNDELRPHTDPADFLSFLCLRPAAEGGTNHFVSSMTIHEELRQHHPELLERLERGYRYSRFGEQADDEEPITPYRVPVFSTCDGHLSCRFVRQYIEIAAAEDADCALDEIDRAALDTFESLAVDPALALSLRLAAGEAIFANNYTVLHDRTGFSDPADGPKRHLLRLWLEADPPRPVKAETRIYPTSAGIPPQPGRTPSYATDVEII